MNADEAPEEEAANVSSAPEPGSMTYGVLLLAAGTGLKFLRRRGQRLA